MSNFLQQQPIILASGSSIRAKLLSSLGLDFTVVPSHLDETAIKLNHANDPLSLGYVLAESKALEVSQLHPQSFIIAADQLCVIDQEILDKPLNHATARKHLRLLSGKTHQQIACLCIAKNNQVIWSHHETATLTMHELQEETIEAYLQKEKPYHSCGAYQFETLGKWLFKEVQGQDDTILGLPLLPLITALNNLNAVHI
ncbi:MAG: septum formation protein Maf [Legionella sp.]|nr:MAG: septum formation protein Maf [Legionella sp.]